MARLSIGLAVASSLLAATAFAESQADIAAKENDEGKDLMFAGKYGEATAKFRDAVARVPEAKYFFNLCTSLYQEGKFGEALTACQSAEKNADDTLKGKTTKLEQKLHDEAKAQGIDLQPKGGGGGDTNVAPQPDPGTTTPPPGPGNTTTVATPPVGTPGDTTAVGTTTTTAVGQPPAQPVYAVGRPPAALFVAEPPRHTYVWTLGADVFAGGGQIGDSGFYGTAVEGLRVKADYLFLPQFKIGAEGYIQWSHLAASANQMAMGDMVQSLDVFDVGIAAYKHFCQRGGHFCLTPLVGVHLSLMTPTADEGDSEEFAAAGARLELAASYAFGPHLENVFSAMVGLNAYTGAFASPSDCTPGANCAPDVGLDSGGAYGYLGLGYTYRFNTPFGQAPFVTLE